VIDAGFQKTLSTLFDDNRAKGDHGRKSLQGGAVSIAGRAINALVQVGSVIFLARLLTPEDYGLVAMVTAVTGFAPILVDLGTRDAVLQKARITEAEVSALFWVAMTVAFLFALLVAASGPIVAQVYREPRLTEISFVSSMAAITSALACQHTALMRRAMLFNRVALIETAAGALGAATAVIMAFCGSGYWALVLRPIVTTALIAIGVWSTCRWIPGKPEFSKGVKSMLKFGLHLTGFTMTDFVGRSIDRVAIGLGSGAESLGFYQKSMLVYDNMIDVLSGPLHSVACASLSKVKEDLPELKRAWSKALETLTFFAMPAFGLLAVMSRDLIVVLLGEKWSYAGALLSVLALRGIPHVVERTLGWLYVVAGRADRWMRWGVFATGVQAVALLCGLPFGAMGIAIAYSICMYLLFIPAVVYAGQPLQIRVSDMMKAIGRPLLGTLGAIVIVSFIRDRFLLQLPQTVRLVLTSSAYGTVFFVVVVGFFKMSTPLYVARSLLDDFFHLKRLRNRPGKICVGTLDSQSACPEEGTSNQSDIEIELNSR
jgi:PST family polysaccharide transporter